MQLANKSSHILVVSKTNVHNNDTCLINFTTYLFSCVKFSWIKLTLKIYYIENFPIYGTCMHPCMHDVCTTYAYMDVHMYVCMYICKCIYTYIPVHT